MRPIRGTVVFALTALLLLLIHHVPGAAWAGTAVTNTDPPVISGDAVFGTLLQTSRGVWTPSDVTFTFQWRRDGAEIQGATGRFHRLSLDDIGTRVSATVTATDSVGNSASVTTEPTARVTRAMLVNLALPTIQGVKRFTHTLSATAGEWSKSPSTIRFRWLRSGEPILGATHPSYTLQAADVGSRIAVRVTVGREGYRRAAAVSDATSRIEHRVPVRRTVTYRIETRGRITASMATFRSQVLETYRDPRGWRSAGVVFKPVARGGTFSVVLAQASWVPRFSSACSAEWSCRVGRYVIINQTRWLHASPSWNAAHLSRRDYRNMVVNHETGHWLGHGHLGCPGPGRLAPVMMQQSKGLNGCRHNPWPLRSELWTRTGQRFRGP